MALGMHAAGPQKVLLIAGGIGITPMRPMFLDFLKRGVDVILLYCVRSLDDAVCLSELAEVSTLPYDNAEVALMHVDSVEILKPAELSHVHMHAVLS